MTSLTIDLPPEIYDKLAATAQQEHKPVELLAQEWLAERSTAVAQINEREQTLAVLRQAGLLIESSPTQHKPLSSEEKASVAEQVPQGRRLSEIVIEER